MLVMNRLGNIGGESQEGHMPFFHSLSRYHVDILDIPEVKQTYFWKDYRMCTVRKIC